MQIKKNMNILHDKLNKCHFQLVFLSTAIMGEDCNLKQTESLQCGTYTTRVISHYVKANILVTPMIIEGIIIPVQSRPSLTACVWHVPLDKQEVYSELFKPILRVFHDKTNIFKIV